MPPVPGLEVTGIEPATVTATFDLTVEFQEAEDGLHFAVTYRTDLFDQATVTRLADHLTTLLSGLAGAAGDSRVADLPMVPPAETDLVLTQWNAPPTRSRRSPGPGTEWP
jgi:non-ribosomal peptide synthetase component F